MSPAWTPKRNLAAVDARRQVYNVSDNCGKKPVSVATTGFWSLVG
jgi:hypothetical protein